VAWIGRWSWPAWPRYVTQTAMAWVRPWPRPERRCRRTQTFLRVKAWSAMLHLKREEEPVEAYVLHSQ
jgi:hypothetical protein